MADDKKRLNKQKAQKSRAVRAEVDAVLSKRSRHQYAIDIEMEVQHPNPDNGAENDGRIPLGDLQLDNETVSDEVTVDRALIECDRLAGQPVNIEAEPEREIQLIQGVDNTEEQNQALSENEEEVIEMEDGDQHRDIQQNRVDRAEEVQADEVAQIRNWAISNNVPQKTLDDLLIILRRRLLPQLPKSSKTLLKTTAAEYTIREMRSIKNSSGEYAYFGIAKGLQQCINGDLQHDNKILIQINCDGLPLFKSSTKQFWPILCKVFFKPDVYQPFPVAIYAGDAKPMNVGEYLEDFIQEINELTAEGIAVDEQRYHIEIQAFICDTPARSFLKGTIGHGGYYACERCEVRGERIERRTVYPDLDSRERTDASFRLVSQPEHHKYRSPLLAIEPPIDMVQTFILDYMHLCCEGVMKKLTEFWIFGKAQTRLQRRNKLGTRQKVQLSNLMTQLQKCMPYEFQRKPRSVNYIAQWKATEFRFLLLYCGPIVLRGIVNPNLYKHYLLLHVACRILCSNEYAFTHNDYAKLYLRRFVEAIEVIYGRHAISSNAHNLIHLSDDVRNTNCILSDLSAFPFENVLGKIKTLIRNANRPLAQICRRLQELSQISEKVSLPLPIEILKLGMNEDNDDDDRITVKKLKYKNFTLTTEFPNNLVVLENNEIFSLTKITCSRRELDDFRVSGRHWKKKKSIFKYPTESKDLKMWQLATRPSRQITPLDIKKIEHKMVQLKIKPNPRQPVTKMFAIPLLHA